MQSKSNINIFGMTIIVKPKVYYGAWFSCDTYLFCDTYLYTANKNVKCERAKKTFLVGTLREM